MNVEAGQAWFRIAVFFVATSAGLLLIVEPGTAEFVMSAATLALGLVFAGIVIALARLGRR